MNMVIVGAGLAGLIAAREISKNEACNIKIINEGSGASPYVHGLNIPLDERDSVEVFKDDTYKSGHYLSYPELVDILCEGSFDVLNLFDEYDIPINKTDKGYDLLKPLGSTFPRVVSSGSSTGKRLLHCLNKELAGNVKVEFINNNRALKIIKKDETAVAVLTYDLKRQEFDLIYYDCIILAAGGLCGIYPFSTNTADIGGDGIAMAYDAGIDLVDMEFIQFEPSVAPYPLELKGKGVITTMFYNGAILKNNKGERFMEKVSGDAEKVNKDILSKEIYKEVQKGNGTVHGGVYFDATGVRKETMYKQYSSYVLRYKDVGIDITSDMFEITPGPHTSLGGVKIDAQCRTSIDNIFAAGEIIGGLHGANRIGGNAGLETMVFGRQCGMSAAKHKPQNDIDVKKPKLLLPDISGRLSEQELFISRKKMEDILSTSLNVIRNRENLKHAKAKLKELLGFAQGQMIEMNLCDMKELLSNKGESKLYYNRLRLINDITCAYLLAVSAYERKESVGCHTMDSIGDEEEKYHVVIRKGKDGPIAEKEIIA